jgi:N-acetylmuramoyl-L-alanine amidase
MRANSVFSPMGPEVSKQSPFDQGASMNHLSQAFTLLFAVAMLFAFVASEPTRADPTVVAAKTQDKTPAPTCDRANFKVILDVGHSAEVPGALSARGVGEYTFNLNLARLIEKKMVEAGFEKTHLLVSSGRAWPSLASRVHFAAQSPADLFLSIHHDAVPDKFLEKWTYQGRAQNYCDRFKGHSIFISRHNPDYRASLQFAKLLGNQLKSKGMTYAAHYTEKFMGIRQRELIDADAGVYRFDNLVVLMSTTMPAVLFEAGSIINREEETLMADPAHQDVIATAVTTAVESFCQTQGPRKPPPPRVARRPHEANAGASVPSAPPFFFPFISTDTQH